MSRNEMNTKVRIQKVFHNLLVPVILIIFCSASIQADTVFDTDNLTITQDGQSVAALGSASLATVQVVEGVARFNFSGDLNISDQQIRVVGSRPLSIRAGNDLTTSRTTFDLSGHGTNGVAGGGDGGLGGNGYIRANPPLGPPTDQRFGSGGTGTGWGTGHSGFTKSGNDGQAGGVTHYSGDGTDGRSGSGGYAVGGSTMAGSGGSGGSKGSSGSGGAGGVGGHSPRCTSAGGKFGFSQRACDSPGNGGAGRPGGGGASGEHGAQGAGGTNLVTDAALSGGAGGGGGGRAGQGGAGGNGGQGAGGGAGTINAITPLHAVVEGFRGWDGGDGGAGGIGGQGGDSAFAGDGGAGGGAIELFAHGRLTLGESVNLLSRGEQGSAAQETSRIGGPSASGNGGTSGGRAGSNTIGGWTKSGNGGAGGASGRGGAAGLSGLGGGGAGGTVMLTGSTVDAHGASIDTSGGANFQANYQPVYQCSVGGGTGPNCFIEADGGLLTGNAGGDGRAVISTHQLLDGPASTVGASLQEYAGPGESNHHSADGVVTPYLLGLQGGADVFGILSDYSADQGIFSSLFADVSSGLTIGRFDSRAIDLGIDYADFDLLVLANKSDIDIINPMFGFSVANHDYFTPLFTRGWAANVAFGGSGPRVLDALHSNAIWATLVPKDNLWLNVGGDQALQLGLNLRAGDVASLSNLDPASAIPEPTTALLLLLGLLGMTMFHKSLTTRKLAHCAMLRLSAQSFRRA